MDYESEEYKKMLKAVSPGHVHHHSCSLNTHHPEYFDGTVSKLGALDELEMICDWCAATRRNKNGNPLKSVEINAKKYSYGDERKNFYSKLVLCIYNCKSSQNEKHS